jgi:hypothetical protein
MLTITPQPPQQKVAPVADDGTMSRPWYLFLAAVSSALADFIKGAVYGRPSLGNLNRVTKVTDAGSIGEAAFKDSDVVLGAPSLTHAGAVAKVSSSATLTESTISESTTEVDIANRELHVTGISGTPNSEQGLFEGGTQGAIRLKKTGSTYGFAIYTGADGEVGLYDGTNIVIYCKGGKAGLGGNSNPAYGADVSGDANVTGVYRRGGMQVVGVQGAAVTSPSGGGTVVTAPSGGTTIDSQARTAITALIAAVSSAGNTVDPAARTAIDAIRARLAAGSGHGLTA